VQAQGVTLSITSGLINSLGGDEIGFTAAAGANVYRWYASAGNDYEYIGITTTNTFSKKFPPGDNKVKVIMDDCQSLKESNEVSFNAAALSPGFGGSGGGNIIYIYGNFPYASSSDYVPGLVAHYDGINNQGLGDKLHSGDAIEWKDLSGNSYDVKLRIGHSGATFQNATDATSVSDCAGAEWKSNGFLFNGYGYFANVPVNPQAENALSDIMPNLPFGNDNYTVESVFDPSQISGTSNGGFVGWGSNPTTGDNGTSNCTRFYSATATQMQFRHYWYHNDVDVRFTDIASNNIRNFAVTYNNSTEVSPDNRTFYYNGSTNSIDYTGINCGSTTNNCREKTNKHTATCGSFFIGQTIALNTYDRCWPATTPTPYADYANGNKIFSIRVYNKQLTPQEIAANYEVDRRRFTAPPTVTIGGQACSEVVVLSENFLMCKVPAGSPGTQDVVVVSDGVISIYNNAYEYVGSTAFYINTLVNYRCCWFRY
jgi:hypothetical protein